MNRVYKRVKFVDPNQVAIIDDNIISSMGDTGKIHYYDTDLDQLSGLIEKLKDKPWLDVISGLYAEDNPWLYQIITNSNRSDFIFLLPLKEGDLALDLGAGWGQVAIPLSKFCDVVAVEGYLDKVKIMNEIARQEKRDNILFLFCDVFQMPFEKEQFDFAILNGVLEWVGAFNYDDEPINQQQKILEEIYDLLTPNGYLYIGIENKCGLKYLLGEMDDHTGLTDFTYLPVVMAKRVFKEKTGEELRVFVHNKKEYEQMLKRAGFSTVQFFGILPDYKLPNYIVDLSISKLSKYFLETMDFVYEHKGGLDGSYSVYNKKLKDLYPLFSSLDIADFFYPSYAIIAQKGDRK
jgi:SAM-dependent methyltransferase